MPPSPSPPPLELKEEYIKMRRDPYTKLFKATIIGFIVLPLIEASRAAAFGEYSMLALPTTVAFFGLIFAFFILRLKKNQELIITIFLMLLYTGMIIANYYGDSHHFDLSINAYYFGHGVALFEAAQINRMPKFSYRMVFKIYTFVARLVIIPLDDKGSLAAITFCLVFSVYLDFDRERHDQRLFGNYYYSKEQLSKFKDLIDSDITDGIAILTKDLSQPLFSNSAFNYLTENELMGNHIAGCLEKFKVQERMTTSRISTEATLRTQIDSTLFNFIQDNFVHKEFPSQKLSCHVKYGKTISYASHPDIQYSELYFEVRILSLLWDQRPALCVILHDITQQNTILQLKIAANQQKDRILATVSHELRTPLNGILGMVKIMQEQIKENELQHYLNICNNSGYLLLGLVNSILDLNLIRANKLKLSPQTVNLKDFLQEIKSLFDFQCQQKTIYLHTKISPLLPKQITTDKNRLSQIFINLIGNALKFTSRGGILISINESMQNPQFLEIVVEDTGIGIKQEDQTKLFKIFGKLEQEPDHTTVNSQGVGLGLTISNTLAKVLCDNKALEGISVTSEDGKGSKFSFFIRKSLYVAKGNDIGTLDFSTGDISASLLDEGKIVHQDITSFPFCTKKTSKE